MLWEKTGQESAGFTLQRYMACLSCRAHHHRQTCNNRGGMECICHIMQAKAAKQLVHVARVVYLAAPCLFIVAGLSWGGAVRPACKSVLTTGGGVWRKNKIRLGVRVEGGRSKSTTSTLSLESNAIQKKEKKRGCEAKDRTRPCHFTLLVEFL